MIEFIKIICRNIKTLFTIKKCPYYDIFHCPYGTIEECPKIKKNCHHLSQYAKVKNRKYEKNHFLLIILFLSGLLVALFTHIFITYYDINIEFIKDILNVINALSLSLMGAVIIASVIEIPFKIKEFKSLIIDAFTSEEYLKKLNEEKLSSLRKTITNLLHKKDVPNMPKGLIELDQKICDLLKEPYYKVYRQINKCSIKGDNIQKNCSIDFTMHNPYNTNRPITADIGFLQLIYLEKSQNISEVFQILSFKISIDKNKEVDLKDIVKLHTSDLNIKADSYNKKLYITTKNGEKLSQDRLSKQVNEYANEIEHNSENLYVIFTDKIHVTLEYSLEVPSKDNHFTKRMKYPVKYFRLDYSIDDTSMKLYGQLIGTLMDQSNITSRYSDERNSISIETFNWLLPQNGVFVVMEAK